MKRLFKRQARKRASSMTQAIGRFRGRPSGGRPVRQALGGSFSADKRSVEDPVSNRATSPAPRGFVLKPRFLVYRLLIVDLKSINLHVFDDDFRFAKNSSINRPRLPSCKMVFFLFKGWSDKRNAEAHSDIAIPSSPHLRGRFKALQGNMSR